MTRAETAIPALAVALFAAAVASAPAASAQSFDVPDGFVSEIVREPSDIAGSSAVLRVRPDDGAFADLSSIELRPLTGAIADPAAWLKDRMTGSFDMLSADPGGGMESPDSPFADPAFDSLRDSVAALIEHLRSLGTLPLEFCDEPKATSGAVGDYHEMACHFALGPISQYLVLRLHEIDGVWYYTRIQTMNERRLRHLVAIANSFHVD